MLLRRYVPQQPGIQGRIRGQVGIGGSYTFGDYAGKGRGFGQPNTQANGLAHPAPVSRVIQVIVAKLRLGIGVVGGQPQHTGGSGIFQGRGHAETGGLVGGVTLRIGKPAG